MLVMLSGCAPHIVNQGVTAYNNKNYDKAHKLWTQAAQQGLPVAMNNLGALYENIYRDMNQAVGWYTLSARYGYPTAQVNLQRINKPIPSADLVPRQQTSDADFSSLMLLYGLSSNNRLKTNCTSRESGNTVRTNCY